MGWERAIGSTLVNGPREGETLYSHEAMAASLHVNTPHVVHETIDGETILIHLGSGTYYSLDSVGSEVWVALAVAGTSREQLFVAANERFTGSPDAIEKGLSDLLENLLNEGLLVEDEVGTIPDSPTFAPGSVAFAAPVLDIYTDMQEFMLVDPLHDVDEVAGWPHAKRE
jgi:hypothetical protein